MRIWQPAALDDSFDYLSARYARNVGVDPLSAPPLFRLSGRTPNGSDTLTPMNLFLVRQPGIRANASTILTPSSGSLTCERLRTHARLQAYALRRRDYVHLSRITHVDSRIYTRNINAAYITWHHPIMFDEGNVRNIKLCALITFKKGNILDD